MLFGLVLVIVLALVGAGEYALIIGGVLFLFFLLARCSGG